jgi:Ni/Co efflux regulator RcnB
MNSKHLVVSALMTAMLGASGASFAQDRDHDRGDRDNNRYSQRGDDHRGDDRRGDDRRGNDYRGDDRRGNDHRDDRHDNNQARGDRHWDGAGPGHDIRRGARLPDRYRNNQYVVSDYRGHNLRQPPRGYHWVQTGGDYVLAAIATGVIADLIINSR